MTNVTVENLTKVFDTGVREELAVDDIDFEIDDGELVTIVGPSGCGKTTTLRCIAGLETPTSGTIRFDGEEVTDVIPQRRNVAMVFQDLALYSHMTVRENILYPLRLDDVSEAEKEERLADATEPLQIDEHLDKYPPQLSGGQQQRVALARCLIEHPRVFLLDEPTGNLDAMLKIEIRKEIQQVQRRTGQTMIYVTHDQEEAMSMSDKIIVMNGGEIEQIGSPDEVYDEPNNAFVGSFIGTPKLNLLDGTVTQDSIELDGIGELPHDDSLPTGEYTIGFRPPAATTTSRGTGFEATVSLTESTGENTVVYAETPQGEVRVLENSVDVSAGDEVTVAVPVEAVTLFDPETGERITRS